MSPSARRPGVETQGVGDQAPAWMPSETVYLLDVNVLIALLDPVHAQHACAHEWFAATIERSRPGADPSVARTSAGRPSAGRPSAGGPSAGWASCPLVQNGFLRIVSHPRYPNPMRSPAEAAPVLADFCARPDHHFWGDDASLLDAGLVDSERLLACGQITDSYLLALAVRHGGQLATFDRRLVTHAVRGGAQALYLID